MSPSRGAAADRGTLAELSSQLAGAVERAGNAIVAIHARKRIPSSGVVWRDGIIVSASHTVRRDGEIPVTLPNGDSVRASIAGRDAQSDLIALRLPPGVGKAHVAPRADADALRVGSLVLAVGRPGRDVSASFGIVSAIPDAWRTWQGARIDRVMRLDLSIYDGFSGGALVDASGAVLGVNNSALARGTPMALPAAAVDRVVDELLERGHVRRAFLGVAVQPVMLPSALVQRLGLAHETALMVMSVADDSPAERGGLLVGDVLVAVDGAALRRPTDLLDALSHGKPGASLALRVLRAGSLETVSVTPADRAPRAEGG